MDRDDDERIVARAPDGDAGAHRVLVARRGLRTFDAGRGTFAAVSARRPS